VAALAVVEEEEKKANEKETGTMLWSLITVQIFPIGDEVRRWVFKCALGLSNVKYNQSVLDLREMHRNGRRWPASFKYDPSNLSKMEGTLIYLSLVGALVEHLNSHAKNFELENPGDLLASYGGAENAEACVTAVRGPLLHLRGD